MENDILEKIRSCDNEFKKLSYALTLDDTDKIKVLSEFKDNDMYAYRLLDTINDINILKEGLKDYNPESTMFFVSKKVNIIQKFDEQAQFDLLSTVRDRRDLMYIIDHFKDDNLKVKSLYLLKKLDGELNIEEKKIDSDCFKIISGIKDDDEKLKLIPTLNDEEYKYEIMETLDYKKQIDNIELLKSDNNRAKIITSRDENKNYRLDEEERLKKIDLLEFENNVLRVALGLSDKNKIKVLERFDDTGRNLYSLLDSIKDIEILKEGLKYYKVTSTILFTSEKVNIIRKFPEEVQLNLLSVLDCQSDIIFLVKNFNNDDLKIDGLKYVLSTSAKAKILCTVKDNEKKLSELIKIDNIEERGKIAESLSFDYKIKSLDYISNKLKSHFLLEKDGKDYKLSEQERFNYLNKITYSRFAIKVIETFTDDKFICDSIKFLSNVAYDNDCIKKIKDNDLKYQAIIYSINKYRNISNSFEFFQDIIPDHYNDLNEYITNLKNEEDRISKITDEDLFIEEVSKLESIGLKYRLLFKKEASDKAKCQFINLFLEDEQSLLLTLIKDDNVRMEAYHKCNFTYDEFKYEYIYCLSYENQIKELNIFDSIDKKMTVINKMPEEMQEQAIDYISEDENILNKLFDDSNFSLLEKLSNTSLKKYLGNKKFIAINEYKKITDTGVRALFTKYIRETIDNIDEDKISLLSSLMLNIESSNSEEIASHASEFVSELIKSDDPVKAFNKTEKIFLRNHLPYLAKRYLTFLTVHPDFKSYSFENKYDASGSRVSSPTLNCVSLLAKKQLVLSDLIKCSLGSNNYDFYNYIDRLEKGNKLYLEHINDDYNSLSKEDRELLLNFRDNLFTLYGNTLYKYDLVFEDKTNPIKDIIEIEKLYPTADSKCKTLADRVVSSYCHFAGIDTVEEAKREINYRRERAHEVNSKQALENDFKIENGDFIKAFNISYFYEMVQDGILAHDYLGANMQTDATALDTDLSRVIKDTDGLSISEIIDKKNSESGNFGQGYIILKNDPNKINITKEVYGKEIDNKSELIKNMFNDKLETFSNGVGEFTCPYGIRTGFSSSDIDFIVFDEDGGKYDENIYKLIIPIVLNDFYIPIISKNTGELLFTLDDYNYFRSKLNGLKHYNINDYKLSDNIDNDLYRLIASHIDLSDSYLDSTKNKILSIIKEGLDNEYEVIDHINGRLDTSEIQVIDTGSTSRLTNIPYDGDFDFMIRINGDVDITISRKNEFIKKVLSKFDIVTNGKEVNSDLKGMEVKIDDKDYKMDLSFTRKTNKVSYSTEMCLTDRLDTIKELYPDKYKLVLANIIYAKMFLKEHECYKKGSFGEGGLGGVGVENWILQNGGSFYDAAVDFVSHAYKNGQKLDFNSFTKNYSIWDYGQNYYTERSNRIHRNNDNLHDNFISKNLTIKGYENMLVCLTEFINNYEMGNYTDDSVIEYFSKHDTLEEKKNISVL